MITRKSIQSWKIPTPVIAKRFSTAIFRKPSLTYSDYGKLAELKAATNCCRINVYGAINSNSTIT